MRRSALCALLCFLPLVVACGAGDDDAADTSRGTVATDVAEGTCEREDQGDGGRAPDYLLRVGCRADFDLLASEPLDTSIPGARSVKVVFDQLSREPEGKLYFQNSVEYAIHYQFASAHLSGDGLPIVGTQTEFSAIEYSSPDRRFLLGAVTYYEGPGLWALELASTDKATPEMIAKLFRAVRDAAYFGAALAFHPTSETMERELAELPLDVPVLSTEALYAGIEYQPLNLATGVGRLRFMRAAELADTYLSYRDLVVLDDVPNDISVVAGMITETFQTPLSHVNVLARNRKTPNMGLRGAMEDETLRALDGKWVKLTVGAFDWSIEEVSLDAAETFIDAHKPEPVTLAAADLTTRDLRDIEDVVVREEGQSLRDAIVAALPAFGGKAAHFSVMAQEDSIPMPKAFAIPSAYYVEMMADSGLFERVRAWQDDEDFRSDPVVRDAKLAELRDAIMLAPVSEELQATLRTKLGEFPEQRIRFRTSTNSEDLEGFPCAGCYESHTGDRSDWNDVLDAIRESWASIWLFRTYEERSWYGVNHESVTMALLVHHSFPDEEANGVAITRNPYDPTGNEPAFYVNVQHGGEYEVVHPPAGVSSDQLVYSYYSADKAVQYLARSSVLPPNRPTVLTEAQLYELGMALDTIHSVFAEAYGTAAGNSGWYAMDVEFKLDGETAEDAHIVIKQARPYPGRGE